MTLSMSNLRCPLCLGEKLTLKFNKDDHKNYWDCGYCFLIFLDPDHYLSPEKEKAHYETHNNDIEDVRYQKFVSPLVNYVQENIPPGAMGLDFGSGSGPVLYAMLSKAGYQMKKFDPYFCNDLSALTYRYDFIVTSEVVEHFYSPGDEFNKLKYLLKKGGALTLMTEIYHDGIEFSGWYYHRDPTHVCFYRKETFEWIASNIGFSSSQQTGPRSIALVY